MSKVKLISPIEISFKNTNCMKLMHVIAVHNLLKQNCQFTPRPHHASGITFFAHAVNRIQGTGAYLRPSKNKPPCELAISRISRSGAPFWKGECLGYNAKSNLFEEARVDIECRSFEVERSVWQIHLA